MTAVLTARLQQGVTLRRRFLPSATNSARSVVSAYCAVATSGAGRSSTSKKNLLLQHSARVQQRIFCRIHDYLKKGVQVHPGLDSESFSKARNKLLGAKHHDQRQMLEGLRDLKKFAGSEGYYDHDFKATQLLAAAVTPLALLGGKHSGGRNLDGNMVKESPEVTCLLLGNAPAEICTKLCSKISREKGVKPSLVRIGHRGSGSEMGILANEILRQLPSTPN